jgi:3-phosphoshikimate 1-carboxyvinyltransferase
MNNDRSTLQRNRVQTILTQPVKRIGGRIRVPGDKSISHRALMFGALANGITDVSGFLPGEDCLATMAALREMGVAIEQPDATTVQIDGVGLRGLKAPATSLDMGNSGTAMRLFAGLLSGQGFDSQMIGDASLMQRPMERIATPLRMMGAQIKTDEGRPPLIITGGQTLTGIEYAMPVASAQVKSAVLLAGLYAGSPTTVIEPAVTRDHTERMLAQFGYPTLREGGSVSLAPGGCLQSTRINVPGDLSSAAFFILAASIAGQGELVLDSVGLNPTRTGILDILIRMGADLIVAEPQNATSDDVTPEGERSGTIIVRPSRLHGIDVPAELVPLAIDEFPLVFIAAALAEGRTVISGAGELRHKESDRIGVMAAGLRALGVDIQERPDGAVIHGGTLSGGEIDSAGDHRVAMAFAVAGIAAQAPIRIHNTANVATSFPEFVDQACAVGMNLEADDG